MTIISSILRITGYVVRFCTDSECTHANSKTCPNAKLNNNKYYVDSNAAKRILDNILKSEIPIVIGHDKSGEAVVGRVTSVKLEDKGILIDAVIDDGRLIDCFLNQFKVYKREYTKLITFEQYVQNIFSSISLSHNPKTCDVNHIGLVNIPARIGTGIRYCLENGQRRKNYSTNLVDIENIIAAHKVAFLRSPNRRDILNINSKFSYTPDSEYINASYEYDMASSSSPSLDAIIKNIGKAVLSAHLSAGEKDPIDASLVKRKIDECEDVESSSSKKQKVIDTEIESAIDSKLNKMEDKIISNLSGHIQSLIEKNQRPTENKQQQQQEPEVSQQKELSVEASLTYDNKQQQQQSGFDVDKIREELVNKLFDSIKDKL